MSEYIPMSVKLTASQVHNLKILAKKNSVNCSVAIRWAIDFFLEQNTTKCSMLELNNQKKNADETALTEKTDEGDPLLYGRGE